MAFVIVANLDDLEVGDTMLVDELREPICLIRLDDDDVRAIHNTCTHQQQPLHEGTLQEDDTLVCAAHASRYNLTTGTTTTLLTFDSNGFPQSNAAQVRSVSTEPCISVVKFDFVNNAYFVDAQLIQTSFVNIADLPPLVGIIQVGASDVSCPPS